MENDGNKVGENHDKRDGCGGVTVLGDPVFGLVFVSGTPGRAQTFHRRTLVLGTASMKWVIIFLWWSMFVRMCMTVDNIDDRLKRDCFPSEVTVLPDPAAQ